MQKVEEGKRGLVSQSRGTRELISKRRDHVPGRIFGFLSR